MPLGRAGRWQALLYRVCRILYATARGFREKESSARAASLTYYSVLSIVPFLAFAFSVVKAFGLYHRLMDQTLIPYLHKTFAANQSLLVAFEQVLRFVQGTRVSGLSVMGVLFLVYSSIKMLSTVETAFNGIWGARRGRRFPRKLTDYTTMVVVGPLLIAAAVAFNTAAESSAVVAFLQKSLLLNGLLDVLLSLGSIVFACVALVVLYLIMPNVKTRFSSALFGGLIGGLLWHGVLLLHVKFQIGVAKYNALYSGFAAFPIFLGWLYFSWITVLIGALLAASHQHQRHLADAARARYADQELREMLAVVTAAAVSRRFLEGGAPATSTWLSAALGLPLGLVEDVLEALVRAQVLVRVTGGEELGYFPGRDVDALRVADVEEAVRSDPHAGPMKGALQDSAGAALTALLRSRREEAHAHSGSLTLRELAGQCLVELPAVSHA